MVTMQSADNVLKSYYLDIVSKQLNTEINPFFALIKHSTADVWGKEVRRLAQFGVNGGIGAGTEDGNLPNAASNNYREFVTTLKNLFGTLEISDKAVRASENNIGSFVNLLNAEMQGLIDSSMFNFGRMLFGDGSGKLASITAVNDSVVTVDCTQNIIEGMVIDILTEDGNIINGATARRVLSVDRDKKEVVLSGTALTNVDVDNILCVQGSYGLELTGLGAIFKEDGKLYGVDRASNKWMQPYIQKNVGEIDEAILQTAIDRLEERAGSRVDIILCSWGVKRALQNYFSKHKCITDVATLAGGYKSITYNGIPIVADRFCPEGSLFMLNSKDFCLHELCDWRWLEGDDGKILKQLPNKPVYAATLVKYADLICTRPSGQAMLTGITEK